MCFKDPPNPLSSAVCCSTRRLLLHLAAQLPMSSSSTSAFGLAVCSSPRAHSAATRAPRVDRPQPALHLTSAAQYCHQSGTRSRDCRSPLAALLASQQDPARVWAQARASPTPRVRWQFSALAHALPSADCKEGVIKTHGMEKVCSLTTAWLGAKRGYNQLQTNLESLKSFKIQAQF